MGVVTVETRIAPKRFVVCDGERELVVFPARAVFTGDGFAPWRTDDAPARAKAQRFARYWNAGGAARERALRSLEE